MKFNRGLVLCVFLMITTTINISHVCATEAKRNNMMDFMNNFLSSTSNADLAAQAVNNDKSYSFKEVSKLKRKNNKKKPIVKKTKEETETEEESEEENSYGLQANSTMSMEAPGLNPNTTELVKNPNPVLEEWFMISSKAFLDTNRFPTIVIGQKKTVSIKTDQNNYRINGAYGNKNLVVVPKLPNDKFFWFRLSGLNMYYSSTKTDINILGAISVESIDDVTVPGQDSTSEFITTCFKVKDSTRAEWKICGMKEDTVKAWFCQMKSFLNIKDLNNCPEKLPGDTDVPKVVVQTTEILSNIVIIPTPSKHCNENWNYQKLTEDWDCDCKEGREQSPIDLPKIPDAIESTIKPMMEYAPVKESGLDPTVDESIDKEGKLRLKLQENLLRIFADKFGRLVTIDGAIFHATEINIHCPSEHTLNGKKYDLEVSILHSGVSVGDIAKSATVSFLFEKAPGKYNGFIEDLDIFDLPNTLNTSRDLKNPISVSNIFKTDEKEDMSTLLPFSFFTYQGSLTTPPCTEDTIVYVASSPLQIGSTSLQLIQEATRVPDMMDNKGNIIISNWINDTSRPVQPLNGRPIFHFDHTKVCGPPQLMAPEKKGGHYEKIRKAMTSYFYVSNNKPSGLPQAMVVSKDEAEGKGNKPVLRRAPVA